MGIQTIVKHTCPSFDLRDKGKIWAPLCFRAGLITRACCLLSHCRSLMRGTGDVNGRVALEMRDKSAYSPCAKILHHARIMRVLPCGIASRLPDLRTSMAFYGGLFGNFERWSPFATDLAVLLGLPGAFAGPVKPSVSFSPPPLKCACSRLHSTSRGAARFLFPSLRVRRQETGSFRTHNGGGGGRCPTASRGPRKTKPAQRVSRVCGQDAECRRDLLRR